MKREKMLRILTLVFQSLALAFGVASLVLTAIDRKSRVGD